MVGPHGLRIIWLRRVYLRASAVYRPGAQASTSRRHHGGNHPYRLDNNGLDRDADLELHHAAGAAVVIAPPALPPPVPGDAHDCNGAEPRAQVLSVTPLE